MEDFEKWNEEETRQCTKELKVQLLEQYEFQKTFRKEKAKINSLRSFISKTKKFWIFSSKKTITDLYLVCRAENSLQKYSEKQLSHDIILNNERIKDLEDIIHGLNSHLKKRLKTLIKKVLESSPKYIYLSLNCKIQRFLEFAIKNLKRVQRGSPPDVKENTVLLI